MLYGDAERKALQRVQPDALGDEARAVGVEWSATPEEELLTDHAYALNTLWNIDKHRRLPRLAGGVKDCAGHQVIRLRLLDIAGLPGNLEPLVDGSVLVEVQGHPGGGRPQVSLNQRIELVLLDDPSPYPSALVARLERLHQVLSNWVVPRIFFVADGASALSDLFYSAGLGQGLVRLKGVQGNEHAQVAYVAGFPALWLPETPSWPLSCSVAAWPSARHRPSMYRHIPESRRPRRRGARTGPVRGSRDRAPCAGTQLCTFARTGLPWW